MGHKTFAIALILGLVTLPLACSGDDDDDTTSTGGSGGSAGKGGSSSTAGSSGKGGGGKGGTAPTDGGEGGTGNTGNTGNVGNTGNMGGEPGGGAGGLGGLGGGGMDAGGAGAGGGGGEAGAPDLAAQRLARCTAICTQEVYEVPFDTTSATGFCTGDSAPCISSLCLEGSDGSCDATLDDYLDCLENDAPKEAFYCGDGMDGFNGQFQHDIAGSEACESLALAWLACYNALP